MAPHEHMLSLCTLATIATGYDATSSTFRWRRCAGSASVRNYVTDAASNVEYNDRKKEDNEGTGQNRK